MPVPSYPGTSADVRPDKLLRLRDVIELTSLSRATIYRLVAQGAFPPPVKCGFSSRWAASEIAAFIEELKVVRVSGGDA